VQVGSAVKAVVLDRDKRDKRAGTTASTVTDQQAFVGNRLKSRQVREMNIA
jgi:hypothetical protein